MKKYTDTSVTVTIPANIVKHIIQTQKRVKNGKEKDEYAARIVIAEWLCDQIDTEYEIFQGILTAYNIEE